MSVVVINPFQGLSWALYTYLSYLLEKNRVYWVNSIVGRWSGIALKASASLWSLSQLLHSISLILQHFCIASMSLCLVATFDCKVQINLLNNSHDWMLSSIILAHTPVKFSPFRLQHWLAIALRSRRLCKQWKLHYKLSTWRLGHTIASWLECSDHHHEKSKWVAHNNKVINFVNDQPICVAHNQPVSQFHTAKPFLPILTICYHC